VRLLLLSPDPGLASHCLYVDAHGAIIESARMPTGASLPPRAAARDVLAVPSEAVALHWLDLPGSHPLQLRAAARARLEDQLAVPLAGQHVAVSAGPTAAGPRCVAVVAEHCMAEWKQRALAMGLQPTFWVPDCLLLAAPEDETLLAVAQEERLLVRGRMRAFSAEAPLAVAVAGPTPLRVLSQAEGDAALAQGAARAPALDLLQFEHALPDTRATRSRRRRCILAAVVLLSPLLLVIGQALRDVGMAAWMQHRADAVATRALGNAVDALQALHRQRLAPFELARQSHALFDQMKQHEGTRLDSYEFDAYGGLRLGLLHRDPAQLEAMQAALSPAGIALVPLESTPVEDGVRSVVSVEASR